VDPKSEYAARLAARQTEVERREQSSRRIGNLRLLVAIAGVAIAFFVFGQVVLSPWWLIPPAAVFAILVVVHSRMEDRLTRARRAAHFYQSGNDRLQGHWIGRGEPGDRFANQGHVYADDLDVFGKGGLFELLSTARTRPGEDVLAGWLLTPAPWEQVEARQQAVIELRPQLDLREDFAILGDAARAEMHSAGIATWGESPAVALPNWLRPAAAILCAAVLLTFSLYMAQLLTRTPLLAALFLVLALTLAFRSGIDEIANRVEASAHDLELLSALVQRFERETFRSACLQALSQRICSTGRSASLEIAKLRGLVERLDWEHNVFLRPLAAAVLWRLQLALAVERWRARSGPAIRDWLTAISEFEALLALSGYSFEHPADPFPTLSSEPGCFEAEGLGHPLMAQESCVPNDVRLGGELRLLVVSGSNMSGKSTLLRSVGLNTVLAWCGAPVRATRLVISPLSLGVSIRVLDSLQDGRSRFYAEITRIREIVDLLEQPSPVLFLMDEMLSGTNSHDRRIGAEAIVRSLVDRGAIGIITTHDLALANIAGSLAPAASNVHFVDTLVEGKLHFDYRLHPGVVERSNALELMRAVGLRV
jgi:MutS domain V